MCMSGYTFWTTLGCTSDKSASLSITVPITFYHDRSSCQALVHTAAAACWGQIHSPGTLRFALPGLVVRGTCLEPEVPRQQGLEVHVNALKRTSQVDKRNALL